MSAPDEEASDSDSPKIVFYGALAIIIIVTIVAALGLTLRSNPITPTQTTTNNLAGYPARGKTDAPVTVVEYADFQDSDCAFFATTLAPDIIKNYIDTGKVRFVYHDFPRPQHSNAFPAGEAARCAGDQNAFWQMHDLLYAKQSEWAENKQVKDLFGSYATQLKLDRSAFDQCMKDGNHFATLVHARQDAEINRISGTPTFVIDGKQYKYTDLAQAIDTAPASKK